jgi:hypothetical protein
MKAVQNLLRVVLPGSTGPSMPETLPAMRDVALDRQIELLFALLEIHYGGRWTSRFSALSDTEAKVAMKRSKNEWARYTDDLSGPQRRRAIDNMPCGPDAWPPSPVEFRHLALGTEGGRGWALAHRPFPPADAVSEERQAARRQAGDTEIAKMRVVLGVRGKPDGAAAWADLEQRRA